MTIEILGCAYSGSLALMADAAHQAFDVVGFACQIGALILARRQPSEQQTYGRGRYEHFGALVTILLIW